MSNPINILLNNIEVIGSISFIAPDHSLSATRTATGFRLLVPALVNLRVPNNQAAIQLDELCADFSAPSDGRTLLIGSATYRGIINAPIRELTVSLDWDWTTHLLDVYERLRCGNEPSFQLTISCALYVLLPFPSGQQRTRSVPDYFSATSTVTYSREVWINTLRSLNLRDAVIAEIPLLSEAPPDWVPVYAAIKDARAALDSGGSTGWRNCVGHVRHALEEWRGLEKEETGPGGTQANNQQRHEWTKMQRAEFLRWSLLQYAHHAPHSHADDWTREDALLALSTLCALIAARRP